MPVLSLGKNSALKYKTKLNAVYDDALDKIKKRLRQLINDDITNYFFVCSNQKRKQQ